ncbi:Ig-like domain-containing protein [Litorilituus lipolyticus]|nr:Ig-like domain-containing protein [Litorilituus lipolyticus]
MKSIAVFTTFSFSTLAYAATPSFSAIFTPDTIGSGNQSVLSYTITNSNGFGIRDIAFTNTLPVGVTIADPESNSSTCTNGSLSASANDNVITFSGGTLASNASCTVSVNVTSTTVGTHTNLTDDLTSDQGNSGTATGNLTVNVEYATYALSLSNNQIVQGGASTLTIDITNLRAVNPGWPEPHRGADISGVINLPGGIEVADVPNLDSNCSGIRSVHTPATASANSSLIDLGKSKYHLNTSCQITVDVKSNGALGDFVINSSLLQEYVNVGTASTLLTVNRAFGVMSFNPNPVTPNSNAILSITLTNYDRNFAATNISFLNDLDAALSGLVATGLPISNVCGSGSTLSGTSTISLSGGILAGGTSCTIDVPVSIPSNATFGSYTNTTSSFTYDLNGSSLTEDPISSSLTITNGPQLSLSFQQSVYAAGDEAFVDFTITNIDPINAATDIEFNASINDFISYSIGAITTLPAANSCGAGSTFANTYYNTDDFRLDVKGANLAGSTSCTFTVGITLQQSLSPGIYSLSTSELSSVIDSSNINTTGGNDSISIVAAPQLTMSLSDTSLTSQDTSVLTFSLSNSDLTNGASAIGFTVDLDVALSGLTATSLPTGDICGAGSIISGTGLLTFSSGSLSANSTCSFDVIITVPANAPSASINLNSSAVTANVATKPVVNVSASTSFQVSTLVTSMAFAPDALDTDTIIQPGDLVDLTFTLQNTDLVNDITGLSFNMSLSGVLSGLVVTPAILPVSDQCGSGSTLSSSGTSFLIFTSGSVEANSSCDITVSLQVPAGAAVDTYTSSTSNITFTQNSAGVTAEPMRAKLVVAEDDDILATISSSVAPLTSVSPIPFEIVFSENIENFVASDLTVSKGIVNSVIKITDSHYTFEVSSPTDGETTTVQLLADKVDELGVGTQQNVASNIVSVAYDTVALPSATIVVPADVKINTGPVTANVTYVNATEHFLTADKINLYFTGTASTASFVDNETSNPDISVINGDTANPVIQIANLIGNGTLTIGIDEETARNGQGIVDLIANSAESFSIDNTKPSVAITSSSLNPTNASFTAFFDFTNPITSSIDTSISGFTSDDISLTNATITNFTGSAGSYSATIHPISDGVVMLDIAAGVAQDDHGNSNTEAAKFALSFDGSKPNVVISSSAGAYNSAFTATINFDENVTGFTIDDLSITNGVLSSFNSVNMSEYTVLVTPSAGGQVSISVGADKVQDVAGNLNLASNLLLVDYDISAPSASLTSTSNSVNSIFIATISFNEGVIGFDISDLTVSNATLSQFSSTSSQLYTVVVTPVSTGDITLSVAANIAQDSAGNNNTSSNILSVNYETKRPTVSISSSSDAYNSAFTAVIEFSEDVSGFNINDLAVNNATLSQFSGDSAQLYTVLVTPVNTGDVTLSVEINAAQDSAGNFNTSSNILTVSYEIERPTVSVTSSKDTYISTFTAVIEFSENVSGFDVSDIVVSNASLSQFNATNAQFYTVRVTPIKSGDVTLTVSANSAQDSVGNFNFKSNTLSVSYESERPTVSVTSSKEAYNTAFIATVNFSENVIGFTISDVTVSNASLSQFSENSAQVYTILVTPNGDGEVNLSVGANVTQDSVGNLNTSSNILSVTYDTSAPILTSTLPQNNDSVSSSVQIGFIFNENITAVAGGDKLIEIFKEGTEVVSSVLALSSAVDVKNNSVILVEAVELEEGVDYFVKVTPGAFIDNAGNSFAGITDQTTFNFTVGNSAPVSSNDRVEVVEDKFVIIDVLANDFDSENNIDPQTLALVSLPTNGEATIDDGKVIYKPFKDFYGTDSFSYTVLDTAKMISNEANVSVDVSNVNDVPVLVSEKNVTALPLILFSYQMRAVDVDNDFIEFNASGLAPWMSFDGIDTISGTPQIEDVDSEYMIKITIDDGVSEVGETYELTVNVNNTVESNLLLIQTSSVAPVLVGSEFDLTYTVDNLGVEVALLDVLTIEINGASNVNIIPESCELESFESRNTLTCTLPEQLAMADTFSLTLSLSVSEFGTGEITSKMSVTQLTSDTVQSKDHTVVVANMINNEEGLQLVDNLNTSDHALGDLNNDGQIDLVLVSSNSEQGNTVLLNIGAGNFNVVQVFSEGTVANAIDLVDLDNDGFLDIVIANSKESASGYHLNDGNGMFGSIISLGTIDSTDVTSGDFNNDGLSDIAFSELGSYEHRVYIQPFAQSGEHQVVLQNFQQDQNISENDHVESKNTLAVKAGDFNGDGYVDLVFVVDHGPLDIMLNDGTGIFTSELVENTNNTTTIEVADINGDGIDDVLFANNIGVTVVIGGTEFYDLLPISALKVMDIAIADIELDGILDILLLDEHGSITFYTLNDNSKFIRKENVLVTNLVDGFSLADMDGDGDLDIVLTSQSREINDEIRFNHGNGNFGAQTVDIGVTISAGSSVMVNDNYQVTLRINNNGLANADTVLLKYGLSKGEVISISDTTLDCELIENSIQCKIPTLNIGDTYSLVITVSALSAGESEHTAFVSTASFDDDLTNNEVIAKVTINEKPVVIPVQKKSSGSMSILLLLLFLIITINKVKIVKQ